MARKLKVIAALKCGFDMVGIGWRRAGLALALMAVAYTVFNGAQGGGSPILIVVGFVTYMALSFMATGALYRLSTIRSPNLNPADLGAGGLQWKATETALLKLTLLLAFLVLLVVLLLVVIFALAIAASGMDMAALEQLRDPAGVEAAMADPTTRKFTGIMAVVSLAVYGLVIWLGIRMVMVNPVTAATGKVEIGKAWALTKGNFWRLLGGTIVVALPPIFLGIVTKSVADGGQMTVEQTWAFSAVLSLVYGFLGLPMQVGFVADAYRQLTNSQDGA